MDRAPTLQLIRIRQGMIIPNFILLAKSAQLVCFLARYLCTSIQNFVCRVRYTNICTFIYNFSIARLAQSVEHQTSVLKVSSSSPTSVGNFYFLFI